MAEEKIYLTFLNGTGYVFDVEDYMQLRTQHRIVGSFVGVTSARGTSAKDCRLPAELSKLETRLLIDEGIALLVSKSHSLLRTPTSEETIAYKAAAEKKLAAQEASLKEEKQRDAARNIDRILAGKRTKLQRIGKTEEAQALTAEAVLQDINEKFVFDQNNALLEIACAHPVEHDAYIVKLPPLTSYDSLKYRVFREFWQLGKFITPGDAFGGDFLIYPGDPMLYHASHIIIVLEKPTSMQLTSLITKIRLAVVVNKTCVLAYTSEDDADENVHYQTIVWDGSNKPKADVKRKTNTLNA